MCGILSGQLRYFFGKLRKRRNETKFRKISQKPIDKCAHRVYNTIVVEPKTAGYRKSIRAILPRRDLYRNIV